jgi:hypothetical protein
MLCTSGAEAMVQMPKTCTSLTSAVSVQLPTMAASFALAQALLIRAAVRVARSVAEAIEKLQHQMNVMQAALALLEACHHSKNTCTK